LGQAFAGAEHGEDAEVHLDAISRQDAHRVWSVL